MHDLGPEYLTEQLRDINDPQLNADIVSLGLVEDLTVENNTARITLGFNAPYSPDEMAMASKIRSVVENAGLDPELQSPMNQSVDILSGVRNIIAVTSGKGGVGKSTIAANLAHTIADRGADVGLLDADVYGPNIPQLLDIQSAPTMTDDGYPIPVETHGLSVMSPGLVIPEADAAALRGPMINSAIQELLTDVRWGDLDYLIVDLPPGTGDVKITLLQTVPVTGVIGVTTPQSMATDDAIKGLDLFGEHNVPVIGIIENMSSFECPSCGDQHEVFGSGGGDRLADAYDTPVLGNVPVDPTLNSNTPSGVVTNKTSPAKNEFETLAKKTLNRVGVVSRKDTADSNVLHNRPSQKSESWL
ncbi:Mrp/NBP35 family ATP-binding protein [Salinarchaeum sp. IM2453]|uniref:Mrp/NBP35 family ATP-binding protein n=1 Tax=Salinarchaeum sp. IM2453 TaxID=2862870 RepID=UPI001C83B8E0|nr:P-loop NTPase [Salinarchaeum sp. IM2453]QZA87965.1 Mrp/NBP35 family ATP-binding protein [Salinarchaeum sp. IM2453]